MSASPFATEAARMCELFKLLRCCAMSRLEIGEAMGSNDTTVNRWLRELVAHGMLIERQATERRPGKTAGNPPMLYALSAQWGGVA